MWFCRYHHTGAIILIGLASTADEPLHFDWKFDDRLSWFRCCLRLVLHLCTPWSWLLRRWIAPDSVYPHGRDALQQLEPIIASARALQDWRRLSQSLNVRGNAHSGLREWALAVADYQECIATAWKSVASFDLAHGLWNLPRALAHLRQPEAAVRIAGFASWLWRSRFGELTLSDARYLRCVRRLATCQIGATRVEALRREGEQLSPSQAVAIGLGRLPTA